MVRFALRNPYLVIVSILASGMFAVGSYGMTMGGIVPGGI